MDKNKKIALYQPEFDEYPILLNFNYNSIRLTKDNAKQLLNELNEIFNNIEK